MLIRQNLIPLFVETEELRSQIVTLNVSPAQTYLPHAFTKQGVTMLFSVLHSQRAIGVNFAIMRAFVQMQRVLEQNVELLSKKPLLASVELYSRIIITLANLFGLRLSHPSTGFEMISSKIYNVVPDATLICSIILAYLFDRNFPIIKIIPFPASLIGWLMIVWGIDLTLYILAILRSKHTSTDPTGIPSEFITDGLFSRSRNPLYLSYVLVKKPLLSQISIC